KKIYNIFSSDSIFKTLPDSNKVYAFAFKASVKRDSIGNISVLKLTANDPIAYTIYPNYKLLQSIDYSLFMDGRDQATFLFPVLLQVGHAEDKTPAQFYSYEIAMKMFDSKNTESDITERIYFGPFISVIDKTIRY
ncbi:MAG TPA: hypothetical protein VGD22_17900, partial [Sphingobacteriaceae bacterium]